MNGQSLFREGWLDLLAVGLILLLAPLRLLWGLWEMARRSKDGDES